MGTCITCITPSYFWNKFAPFNFPVFFRQFCVVYVIFVSKGFGVVVESIFNENIQGLWFRNRS